MDTGKICTQFLSETLNNKSKALATQMLPTFLQKLSKFLEFNNSELRIKVKPLGKQCLHCGKYIPTSNLHNAIGLWCNATEHLMCNVKCLQRHALVCTNFTLLDLNYVTCPKCWTSIHSDQILEAFGDKFEQIQSDACDKALYMLLDEEGKKEMEPKFTCEVCLLKSDVAEGITLECDHRFCMPCMKSYTTNLIEEAQVGETNLKCPNCSQPMTSYEVEEIVGPEVFEKYQKFLLRGYKLSGDDLNNKIFNCHGLDCEFFCIVDNILEDVECPKCFKRSCPKCFDEPHVGKTCEEYKASKASSKEDEEFKKMLKQEGIINCPSCGAAVQRISGCEFMVCTSSQCQSKTYFCYDCGIKLEADHAPHNCSRALVNYKPPQPYMPINRVRPRKGVLRKFQKQAAKIIRPKFKNS